MLQTEQSESLAKYFQVWNIVENIIMMPQDQKLKNYLAFQTTKLA